MLKKLPATEPEVTKQIIAGQDLYATLQAEREARVAKVGNLYKGEPLCRLQEQQAGRGVLGAELVLSRYGWSVRYDSGLQNWGLLASSRSGMLDGTLEAAVAWATAWVAQDPQRRYAWRFAKG